jgi:hypothetical protein
VGEYFAEKDFRPEWFAQVIRCPKFQRPRLVPSGQSPRHENDRDEVQSRIPFDLLANLEPANIGQINVGKNEVEVLTFGESQALGSGRRLRNVKATVF